MQISEFSVFLWRFTGHEIETLGYSEISEIRLLPIFGRGIRRQVEVIEGEKAVKLCDISEVVRELENCDVSSGRSASR